MFRVAYCVVREIQSTGAPYQNLLWCVHAAPHALAESPGSLAFRTTPTSELKHHYALLSTIASAMWEAARRRFA
jgi:hypothetical protein